MLKTKLSVAEDQRSKIEVLLSKETIPHSRQSTFKSNTEDIERINKLQIELLKERVRTSVVKQKMHDLLVATENQPKENINPNSKHPTLGKAEMERLRQQLKQMLVDFPSPSGELLAELKESSEETFLQKYLNIHENVLNPTRNYTSEVTKLLCEAIASKKYEVTYLLLKQEVDVTLTYPSFKCQAPIHLLCSDGNLELLEYVFSESFLFQHRRNIDYKLETLAEKRLKLLDCKEEKSQRTPLHVTISHLQLNLASFLIKSGASKTATDALGLSPSDLLQKLITEISATPVVDWNRVSKLCGASKRTDLPAKMNVEEALHAFLKFKDLFFSERDCLWNTSVRAQLFYQAGDYVEAFKVFRQATPIVEDIMQRHALRERSKADLINMAILCYNSAKAAEKVGLNYFGITSCTQAIELKEYTGELYFSAYFQRAQCYSNVHQYENSLKDIEFLLLNANCSGNEGMRKYWEDKEQLWRSEVLRIREAEEAFQDLYQLLGVSPNATILEIKKAFHKKCLRYHPDKVMLNHKKERKEEDSLGQLQYGEAKQLAELLFKKMSSAYEVLKDKDSRAIYDLKRLQKGMYRFGNLSTHQETASWYRTKMETRNEYAFEAEVAAATERDVSSNFDPTSERFHSPWRASPATRKKRRGQSPRYTSTQAETAPEHTGHWTGNDSPFHTKRYASNSIPIDSEREVRYEFRAFAEESPTRTGPRVKLPMRGLRTMQEDDHVSLGSLGSVSYHGRFSTDRHSDLGSVNGYSVSDESMSDSAKISYAEDYDHFDIDEELRSD